MDLKKLIRKFDQIGGRLKINLTRRPDPVLSIDIEQKEHDECFVLNARPTHVRALEIIDIRSPIKHLLLSTKLGSFLCGRDESHWFVAAIPDEPHVTSVPDAMEALKPDMVLERQDELRLSSEERMQRNNRAYVRQGEWFFVRMPHLKTEGRVVLRDEPLSRGTGSKPHIVDEVIRFGGDIVYVSQVAPRGFTANERDDWIARNPDRQLWWREARINATVYARGCVSHPDHRTIELKRWHQVVMNRENEAPAMEHVVFLD